MNSQAKTLVLLILWVVVFGAVGALGAYIGTGSIASASNSAMLFGGIALAYGLIDGREDILPRMFGKTSDKLEENK